MSINYNSDLSYIQSQNWNQRTNKFDLNKEASNNPKLSLKENEVKITETTKVVERLDSSKIEKLQMTIDTQNPKVKNPETESIEIQSKKPSLILEESIQESQKTKEKPISEKVNSTYQAKTGFHLWLKDLSQIPNEKPVEVKQAKINSIQNKAQKLIKTDLEEIKDLSPASETLASLLVSQGYHREAIAMYEKLSSIFPEKKATFAALIGKLKN